MDSSKNKTFLPGLFGEEEELKRKLEELKDAKFNQYLEDLREVLRMEGGAGMRVIWRMLDKLQGFTPISATNSSIYGKAALSDMAKEILAEIVLADPRSHTQILLEGSRQYARDRVLIRTATGNKE